MGILFINLAEYREKVFSNFSIKRGRRNLNNFLQIIPSSFNKKTTKTPTKHPGKAEKPAKEPIK